MILFACLGLQVDIIAAVDQFFDYFIYVDEFLKAWKNHSQVIELFLEHVSGYDNYQVLGY